MSGRYVTPMPGRILAFCAAAAALASWHAGPAHASSSVAASCAEAECAPLEIPASQLHASSASHEADSKNVATEQTEDALPDTRYLPLEAEAALRQVFEDSPEAGAEPGVDDPVEEGEKQPAIKARVPGVSEGDLARYKRHMYRRDI